MHGCAFDHTMGQGVIEAPQNQLKWIALDPPGFGDNPVEKAEAFIAENGRHQAAKRDARADRLPGVIRSVSDRGL